MGFKFDFIVFKRSSLLNCTLCKIKKGLYFIHHQMYWYLTKAPLKKHLSMKRLNLLKTNNYFLGPNKPYRKKRGFSTVGNHKKTVGFFRLG
jgi:hypothetical protein